MSKEHLLLLHGLHSHGIYSYFSEVIPSCVYWSLALSSITFYPLVNPKDAALTELETRISNTNQVVWLVDKTRLFFVIRKRIRI